jgi:hypothetical protein
VILPDEGMVQRCTIPTISGQRAGQRAMGRHRRDDAWEVWCCCRRPPPRVVWTDAAARRRSVSASEHVAPLGGCECALGLSVAGDGGGHRFHLR